MNPGMLMVERRMALPNLTHFLVANGCYGATYEIEMADQGETGVIAVLADDPAAPLDFQHFCDTSGLALLRNDAEGGVFTLHIEVRADSLQGN